MFTRTKRTWQLGLLATDMAALGLQRGQAAEPARRRLVERLGSLHGLPQKIGQLLALSELDGPSAYADLTESRSPLSLSEALALLEQSLSRRWTECFQSVEPEGLAASLGQVHRALLPDGRPVAVKIQYPDSTAHVETDLTALAWLTTPFGGLGRGFDLSAYQRAIGEMLRRELDYRQEAQALRHFAGLTKELPWVVVPDVLSELSTDRVLTMTWLEGEPFAAVRQWPEAERRQAAQALLRLFLNGCFVWRLLHADPHPGNYRFQRSDQGVRVGLLDFGCVQALDETQVQALAGLVEAARRGTSAAADGAQVLGLYVALGFNADLLLPITHLLPALNRILFEPFTADGPFRLSSWQVGARVENLLGPLRWNFRFAGPANLIFVVRAYLGLLRYLTVLDVAIDWAEVCREVWRGPFRQTAAPVRVPPPDARPVRSRHLRVRVQEAGQVRVDLTFKATLAESLPDLVPPELEDKLRARGLDVNRIAAEAAQRQFAPGELFCLIEGSKQVRVWLD